MATNLDEITGNPSGFALAPKDEVPPPQESFFADTGAGRILHAFGQGASQGWGGRPLGFSKTTEQVLSEYGVFPGVEKSILDPLKLFNRAMLRPLAAALDVGFAVADAGLRSIGAVAHSAAKGAGVIADESGAAAAAGLPGSMLERDMLMMADTLGVLSGEPIFLGLRVKEPPRIGTMRQEHTAQKIMGTVDELGRPKPVEPVPAAAAVDELSIIDPPPPRPPSPDAPPNAVVDKAGNINLDRIAAPDDVKNVIREAATANDDFIAARRSPMTLAQIDDLAQVTGTTSVDLLNRKVGEAFNAEEAVTARKLLVQSAANVRDLAKKAAGGSEQDLLAFSQAVTKHAAIQEQVAGMTAEAGRALSSFNIAVGEAADVSAIVQKMGGRGNVEQLAKMIGEIDDPAKLARFLNEARKARTSEMLIEAWMNWGLLSGPVTHMANITGNLITMMAAIPETALAATVGAVKGGNERVLFGEAGARVFGLARGAQEGVVAAYHTFNSDAAAVGKSEARRNAIPSTKITVAGREIEVGGRQVRIPGRLLDAEDAAFKGVAQRQEINALAYRQAVREGLRGDAMSARIAELVDSPTEAMLDKAREAGKYATFQNDLGKMGQSVSDFSNAHPLSKIVIPFVRTGINLTKYAMVERTPFGLFSRELRDTLAGARGQVAQDTAIARMALGTTVAVATATLAAQGYITGGGPKDPAKRALMFQTGWQPYSVKIGDMYYSYNRLDPWGMTMAVAADFYEIGHAMEDPEANKVGAMIVASLTKNLLNKSWLRGPADLIQAVTDPERYGDRWINHLAGTLVPNVLAQTTQFDDPILRDARTIVDTWKARIPGLSTEVPARIDMWGQEIVREGGAGPDIISPIYQRRMVDDPVNRALMAAKIYPGKLDRNIRGVKLDDAQYEDYQRIAGRLTKLQLDNVVRVPEFERLPLYVRQDVLRRTVEGSRETARSYMLMRHPEIVQKAVDAQMKRITGK